MNWFGFARLIHAIFGRTLPDLQAIERQGLLAVKIAQVFALRIDFLDQERCRHLAQLYRHTGHLPMENLQRLLAQVPPQAFHTRVADIDHDPLASASVGQVHRARLDNQQPVVVKLIKQDVKQAFTRDVRSLRRLFQLAVRLYPPLGRVADPVGILESIEDYTLGELDLRNEISGQQTLQAVCDHGSHTYDFSTLAFPRMYPELSNTDVLVSDYVPGLSFDEMLDQGTLDYDHLLELFRLHGYYMFVEGTFHGDLHPGNVLLHNDTLYLVDTSAVSRVSAHVRQGLFRFFTALAYWDYATCAENLNHMASRPIDGTAFSRFRDAFIRLYADFTDTTVSQVSLTRRMMETIKLGVHSGMVFERGIFPIIKSLMYLDGMVLRCNPRAVLLKDMRRFIGETERLVQSAAPAPAPPRDPA